MKEKRHGQKAEGKNLKDNQKLMKFSKHILKMAQVQKQILKLEIRAQLQKSRISLLSAARLASIIRISKVDLSQILHYLVEIEKHSKHTSTIKTLEVSFTMKLEVNSENWKKLTNDFKTPLFLQHQAPFEFQILRISSQNQSKPAKVCITKS